MILGAISAALGAAFWHPIGVEPPVSAYRPLGGYSGSFEPAGGEHEFPRTDASRQPIAEPMELAFQAIRNQFTPAQAEALVVRLTKAGTDGVKKLAQTSSVAADRRRARRASAPPAGPTETVAIGGQTALEAGGVPAFAGPSFDSVGDEYEADLAKYPLDKAAVSEGIALRVLGVSLARGRYILKFSVANKTASDFFVKDAALLADETPLGRAFFRSFIEPGRTRIGFFLFDKPHPGAKVKIAVKEDKEKGRALEAAAEYPF